MRRAETLMALALVVGAGVLLREALRLSVRWTSAGPGAGFFPFWLTLGVVACAVLVWLQSLRAPATPGRARGCGAVHPRRGLEVLACGLPPDGGHSGGDQLPRHLPGGRRLSGGVHVASGAPSLAVDRGGQRADAAHVVLHL